MKLNEVKPYYESSEDMEEHFFSIQDQGMLFDILRSKMYSNPILAICREITSNARDAHREIGRPDLPIQVHLPVGLEPEFKVKDFGPGISSDRMLNIFIKYTASTKREDNTQTGGFGLGAKTPFSYSDTFTVTTVVDGYKFSYACTIDDTKVGKLILLHKVVSDEPNSTEIAILVKPQDFLLFKQWTEQACRHWETKPVISGAPIVWSDLTKIIDGNGWAVVNDQSNSYYNKTAKLVIDGIEYPLELETLRKYADTKLIDSARGSFIMYFGVGELTLSATREQIFWDKATQDKIRARLGIITKEIKQRVEDKINAFPNLWDANVYYRKELSNSFNNLAFLGKLAWKTHELNNGYVQLKCSNYRFSRGKWSRKTGDDPNKLSRSLSQSLEFSENTQLWYNDLPIKDPTPKHVKKAFDDDPTLKQIQVICPNDICSEKDLNKEIFLDQMQPKKLSSITKASARAYTPAASRLLVFKFDGPAGGFRQVSYDAMEEDPNKEKILATLTRDKYPPNNRWALTSTSKRVPEHALKTLLDRNPKVSIYGLDKDTDPVRVQKEFSDFKLLDTFLDEQVFSNKAINYVEIKVAKTHGYHVDERLLNHYELFDKSITEKKSIFLKKLHIHKKISTMSLEDHPLLEIYESVKGSISDVDVKDFMKKNPDWNLESANQEFDKTYPLLRVIGSYNFHTVTDHIIKYVNMVDKI